MSTDRPAAQLTLGEMLEAAAHDRPDHPFAAGGGRSLTYARFTERTARVASALHQIGVTHGSRVAIMLPNGLTWLEVFFAAARLGAVSVPINPTYKFGEVDRIIDDCDAMVLITDDEHQAMAARLFDERLTLRRIYTAGVSAEAASRDGLDTYAELTQVEPDLPDAEVGADDILCLTYTSGTSGAPRGVLLTHRSYLATAHAFADAVGLDADDRILSALPLCHVAGQIIGALGALDRQASVLLPPAKPAQSMVDTARAANATVLAATPNLLERMAHSEAADPASLESLRLAVTTGAPMSEQAQLAVEEAFGVSLATSYGLTEACGLTTVNLGGAHGHGADCLGKPLDGQQIEVVDDDGAARRAAAVGEVVVRGPNLMQGYVNDPDGTRQALRNDWLHTGDLGLIDQAGCLHFVGRRKELIVRGGDHVYPHEVEEVLLRHPAVADVGVIGVEDPAQGEEVAAFVVVADGHTTTAGELLAYCGEHLANYKCPGVVELRDALPKTPTGRVRKAFLAQTYAERST